MTLEHIRGILAQKGPLPSSEIQQELVLHHKLSRDAARKRIQRLHSSGGIKRFIRLKAGGYLYYLPDLHSMELVISTCKLYLPSYRPRLERIVKLVDEFKLISIFELCRLTNLRFLTSDNTANPKLVKIIKELKLLGINLKEEFLISSSLDTQSVNDQIRMVKEKFEEEAHLLIVAQNYFLDNNIAREITLYRDPSHRSLSNKFDAIGYGGFRKKATIILEFYSRRPVLVEDLIGYHERIWSTISNRKFPKPVFCYVLATSFSEHALRFALKKKMQVVRVGEDFSFHRVQSIRFSKDKVKGWHGRLADAQGRAFESAVERVFKRKGFKTEVRKNFYLRGKDITEEKTRRRLTDIDVFAIKDKEEALLIECKSAKKQVSRSELLHIVKNLERIASYLRKKIEESLHISSVIIGNCNKLDMVDAKRRADVPITFFAPIEFYQEYKDDLKGEPKWLFTD